MMNIMKGKGIGASLLGLRRILIIAVLLVAACPRIASAQEGQAIYLPLTFTQATSTSDLLGQIGGDGHALAVTEVGDRAFVGVGQRLVEVDLLAPGGPRPSVYQVELGRPLAALALDGDWLYALTWRDAGMDAIEGLHVLDVAQPGRPRSVRSQACAISLYAGWRSSRLLVVEADRLYMAGPSILIYELTTPDRPRLAGSIALRETRNFYRMSFDASGTMVYIAEGGTSESPGVVSRFIGLRGIDAADPAAPVERFSAAQPWRPGDIVYALHHDGHLYVEAFPGGGVYVLSDPAVPTRVYQASPTALAYADVVGERLVASGPRGPQTIMDIDVPAAPRPLSVQPLDPGRWTLGLAATEEGFVAIEGALNLNTMGVQAVALTHWRGPSSEALTASPPLPLLWGGGLPAALGSRLLLAQPHAERVAVIDAGAMPMRVEGFIPAPKVRGISVAGDLVLLRSEDGLLTILGPGAAEGDPMKEFSALPLGERSVALAGAPDRAWVGVSAAGGQRPALVGVDLSRPEVPRVLARIEDLEDNDSIDHMAASQDWLMVATRRVISRFRQDGMLRSYDLVDPRSPRPVEREPYDVLEGLMSLVSLQPRGGDAPAGTARFAALYVRDDRLHTYRADQTLSTPIDDRELGRETMNLVVAGEQLLVGAEGALLRFPIEEGGLGESVLVSLPPATWSAPWGLSASEGQAYIVSWTRGVVAVRTSR
jgi:hypothetical protein